MTGFEDRGVQLQHNSRTRIEAQNRFEHSCDLCCNRGLHITCDRCAIRWAHETVISAFDALLPTTGLRFTIEINSATYASR